MKKALATSCMVAMMITAIPTQAATQKTTLAAKTAHISLGTKGAHQIGESAFEEGVHQVAIKNVKKGVKYTCTTSNKKVVTASIKSNKVNLTGLKAGKATITCKQTAKGKTTTIGKITVTVHNTTIKWDDMEGHGLNKITPSSSENAMYGEMGGFYAEYYSTDKNVKYKISVNEKGLTVSTQNTKTIYSGARFLNSTATKAGTYKVTLTQTYKKNKSTSTVTTKFEDTKIKDSVKLYVGEQPRFWTYLAQDSLSNYKEYALKGVNDDIFSKTDDSIIYVDEDYNIHALKEGTVEVEVYYYDTKTQKFQDKLGTVKIDVKVAHTEEIYLDIYDTITYVGADTDENGIRIDVNVEPYESVDPIEVVSSDESVVEVVKTTDEYGDTSYYYIPVGAGTATITATSNGITKSEMITVYATEDEFWEAYL